MKKEEIELYYIQLWFCINRDMLLEKMRGIYDALFPVYELIYREGREQHVDLNDINMKFEELVKNQSNVKTQRTKR